MPSCLLHFHGVTKEKFIIYQSAESWLTISPLISRSKGQEESFYRNLPRARARACTKRVRGRSDEDSPNKAARLIWLQSENGRFHETVHTRIIRRNQPSRPASNNVNNWKSNQNRLLQFDGADWSVGYRLQSLQTACLPSSPSPSDPSAPSPIQPSRPSPLPPAPDHHLSTALSARFSALNRYQRAGPRNTSALGMQTNPMPLFWNALCTPANKNSC